MADTARARPSLDPLSYRDRVVQSVSALFSEGPTPLVDTLDHIGDPGLLGPDSVSWPVLGDSTAFVGGIRALLIQAAHPEVAAGVGDHSTYRTDPLGRLSRTAYYVTVTTYGAVPEVEQAAGAVRRAHRGISGVSERGRPYAASSPELAAWVHNALTDSFLEAYRAYGPRPLSDGEADQFVAEQCRIGHLLVDGDLPSTAASLGDAIVSSPDIAAIAATRDAVRFLRRPPLAVPVSMGYRLVFNAALAITPPEILDVLGLRPTRSGLTAGRLTVNALRWALGSSPSWHLALVRSGADIPPNVFRQPLPPAARQLVSS